ncbi:hypothetical protein P5V15_003698 [Pogonomyrmex californicus]
MSLFARPFSRIVNATSSLRIKSAISFAEHESFYHAPRCTCKRTQHLHLTNDYGAELEKTTITEIRADQMDYLEAGRILWGLFSLPVERHCNALRINEKPGKREHRFYRNSK